MFLINKIEEYAKNTNKNYITKIEKIRLQEIEKDDII